MTDPTNTELDVSDEQLLAAVGLMLDHDDPVPGHMVEAAMAAFTWRTVDAELFDLLFDSAQDGRLATVRAADQPARMLTLASPAYTLEIEVEPGQTVTVRGMVTPATGCSIELESASCKLSSDVSPDGMFEFQLTAAEPFRLTIVDATSGLRTVTPWIDR